MTISADYAPNIDLGNGTTKAFAVDFPFADPADLDVTLFDMGAGADIAPAPVLGGTSTYDYTVTGTSNDPGTGIYPNGTVHFNTAPPGNTKVIRCRSTPERQEVVLIDNARFPAKAVEGGLDHLELQIQEIESVVSRAIVAPVSDGPVDLTLPPAEVRADTVLTFDDAGNIANPGLDAGAIQAAIAAILGGVSPTAPNAGWAKTLGMAQALYIASVVLADGFVLEVACRNTIGDGYGGAFAYDIADSTSTFAQSGLGFVDNAGRRWKRRFVDPINVKWFGAKADGVSDDRTALIAAVSSGGKDIFFPPGTYIISQFIPVVQSDITLIGGGGVIIKNTHATGYQQDGLRLGNPTAIDGGTNVPGSQVYVSNITVRGFQFQNCRIGVWCVYAKNIIVEDIKASGCAAAVSSGNDNDDDCFNITFRDITMLSFRPTAAENFYVAGFFRTQGFVLDGLYAECAANLGGLAYLEIDRCAFGSYGNVHIDVLNNVSDGITLNDSSYIQGSNASLYHCANGHVTYYASGINQYCEFTDHAILTCTNAVTCYAAYNSFSNFTTQGCTVDLNLKIDAKHNWFKHCIFNPGGTAVLAEQVPGGNNGKNLQVWRDCTGIQGGRTDGFYGGVQTAFRAFRGAIQANATGDGTEAVCVFNTEEYDLDGSYNNTTGAFTAPIDGIYSFSAGVNTVGAGFTSLLMALKLGSLSYTIYSFAPTTGNTLAVGSIILKLVRGDTASITVRASGGAKTAAFSGVQAETWFSGILIG